MRIAIGIHTPGQAHFWANSILKLQEKGNNVLTLARDDDLILKLLNSHGVQFGTYGNVGNTNIQKIAKLPANIIKFIETTRRFKPDIILGTGIIEAYSACFLKKPSVIFEDTEITPLLERFQWVRLAGAIITPDCFKLNFGVKHVRFRGYKEIAYLHPAYFTPDPTIFDELKLNRNEKYIVLRFNSFEAIHDLSVKGFSLADKFKLVRELEKYARVFISPEGALPEELEKYRLSVSYDRIHHVLYYAQMFIADTGTTSTEAAILGTPSIICHINAPKIGNFDELEDRYQLLYRYTQPEHAIQKAVELAQQPDLKEQWALKRQTLLSSKIDVTRFMVEFIQNYPQSLKQYQLKHPVNSTLGIKPRCL
jgi:uncharacterized protein